MKNQMFFGRPGETVYGGVDFGLSRERSELVPAKNFTPMLEDTKFCSSLDDIVKEKYERCVHELADRFDEVIEKEFRAFLGLKKCEFLDLQLFVGRFHKYKFDHSPNEFLYIDDKPFLELEPMTSSTNTDENGHFITFDRKYRRLF